MPFMGGADYLGPEFNGDTYRLKFMRDGRVIWVDVDAATGRIIGRSEPLSHPTLAHCAIDISRCIVPSFVPHKQPFSFARG